MEDVFLDAAIVHAVDMIQPAQSALPEQSVHTGKSSTIQNLGVGHSVFLAYAQDTANTFHVEGVESSLLSDIRSPCLAAVQQYANDTGVIDCHLCFNCQLGVYPYTSHEAGESCSCLPDPLDDLCVCDYVSTLFCSCLY